MNLMTKSRKILAKFPSLGTENLSFMSSDQNYVLEESEYFTTLFEKPFMGSDVYLNSFNHGVENDDYLAQKDRSHFENMNTPEPLLYPGIQAGDSSKVYQNSTLYQSLKAVTQAAPVEPRTEQIPYDGAAKKDFNVPLNQPILNSVPSTSLTSEQSPIVDPDNLTKQMETISHRLTSNQLGSQHASGLLTPDLVKSNIVMNPEQAYIKLVPLINKSNPTNLPQVLIAVSRICQTHVSLDDFYGLLLWDERRTQITEIPGTKRIDKLEPRNYRNEGLKLCEFVLRTFKFPGVDVGEFATGLVNNPKLSTIRFDRVRCTFLAIKIILDCTIEVEKPLETAAAISRSSISRAYYIIARAILQKYGKISWSLQTLESMLLKKPQVGRIMNMIYKKFPRRRLGRRGYSQVYYFGLTWNANIIDEEILMMIDAEERKMDKHSTRIGNYVPRKTHEIEGIEIDQHLNSFSTLNSQKCARYSFISTDTKFQPFKSLPRTWKLIPGESPAESMWATSVISKSAAILMEFTIDFRSIITAFFSAMNSTRNHNSGVLGFLQAMEILQRQKVHEKIYLNFYLATLLSTFSLCLSFEELYSSRYKVQVQTTLKAFIKELTARQNYFMGSNTNHYLTFISLIDKITQIVELSRIEVKTSSTKDIVEEFVRDMNTVTDPLSSTEKPGLKEAIIDAVFHAINAYDVKNKGKAVKKSPELQQAYIMKITKSFSGFCEQFLEKVGDIPKSMKGQELMQPMYNLAFQMFVISVKQFHQSCLSNSEVMELPIQAIRAILSKLSDIFIRVSFENFGKRDSELSQQVFKISWVWTFMLNEYVKLHFEIVALAGRIIDEGDGSK